MISTLPERSRCSMPSPMSSRPVATAPDLARRVSSCSAGCSASSGPSPRRFRLERSAAPGGAIAASTEAKHGSGDVLLEELIEELTLRHVDRGLDLLSLTASRDPRWHAVGHHLGAHTHVHERVVVLAHVDGHLKDQTGVLDDPPAPFPASVASRVVSKTDGFVDDDTLATPDRAAQE